MAIAFHQAPKKNFPSRSLLKVCLKKTAETFGKKISVLNYIFLSDAQLLEMNISFLQHDEYTDIITFDQSEEEEQIEGDIYISWERVLENAQELGVSGLEEFSRVMAHGLLHLCGLKDKTEQDQKEMRAAENQFLKLMATEGTKKAGL